MCVKRNQVEEGYHKRYVNHKNATCTLLQTFGAANKSIQRYLYGESESNCYTYIQLEYVVSVNKIKLSEARVLNYDVMAPFIVLYLVDEYALQVEDC